jgi:GntR family transcriptional repressor for pyruvate dehydrogenase complex
MSVSSRATAAPGFSPLKNVRKSDEVFEQISEFIQAGRFAPGGKLPPERELTALFHTSRQTVREAIYRAELVGLVEVRHGTGTFVVAREPRLAIDRPLLELLKTEAHRTSEFFEIRRALEGWCATQAAKVADKADVAAMREPLEAMRDLDVTEEAWERNDIAFHAALARATGNPLAIRIMEVLREGFSAFYRLKSFIPNREDQKLIWQHHFDIYDAVRRHAPDEARSALVGHMDFIEGKLGESMDDLDSDRR